MTMEKKLALNLKFEHLILLIIIAYYVFPKSVQYIRAVGILGASVLWLFLAMRRITSKELRILGVILGISLIETVFHIFTGYSLNEVTHFGLTQYLFFFPSLVYFHYLNKGDYDAIKLISNAAIVLLVFGEINTLIVLNSYPYAARVIASTSAASAFYTSLGAGGYGFIYATVLLTPCLFRLLLTNRKNLKKGETVFLLLITAISFILIIKAGYAIALIVLFCGILLTFCKKRKDYILVGIVFMALLIFADNSVISDVFRFFAGMFGDGTEFNKKLNELSYYFATGIIGKTSNDRLDRYVLTWNAIKAEPVLGFMLGSRIQEPGGHTSWLDLYALYGIFAILYYGIYYFVVRRITVPISKDNKALYLQVVVIFILLGFFNPIHQSTSIGFVLFMMCPAIIETYNLSFRKNISKG